MIVLSVLLFVLGTAVLVTGLLGLTGKLPGNRWIGLHIPEVRKSRTMWDTAHRIVGPFWTGAGIAILLGGLVSLQGGWLWIIAVILVVGGVLLVGTGAANASHIMAQIDLRKGQEAEARRAAAGCCSSGSTSGSTAGPSKAPSAAGGLSVPAVETGIGVGATGDTCGGSCSDCGACDHGEEGTPDLEAARRAMAARDTE